MEGRARRDPEDRTPVFVTMDQVDRVFEGYVDYIDPAADPDTGTHYPPNERRGNGAVLAARDAGVRISIASDAHAVEQLDFMRYGVAQARRGWIERRDVVNTLSLSRLRKAMRG